MITPKNPHLRQSFFISKRDIARRGLRGQAPLHAYLPPHLQHRRIIDIHHNFATGNIEVFLEADTERASEWDNRIGWLYRL